MHNRLMTTTSKDSRFFLKAEELSKSSDHYRFKIGALITKGRKIISTGYNTLLKSHPLQAQYAALVGKPEAIFLHAEMAAIIEARSKNIDLNGTTLYIFRRGLGGDVRIARPCMICMNAIKDHGIKEICYTTDMGYAKETLI